jgi:hypothetical protein
VVVDALAVNARVTGRSGAVPLFVRDAVGASAAADRDPPMQITDHAELRYRQRVDPTEPFPRSRLRELFEKAERVPGAVEDGVGYVAGEIVLAVKHGREPVVTTVLERGRA